jgi:hypothetical protein
MKRGKRIGVVAKPVATLGFVVRTRSPAVVAQMRWCWFSSLPGGRRWHEVLVGHPVGKSDKEPILGLRTIKARGVMVSSALLAAPAEVTE